MNPAELRRHGRRYRTGSQAAMARLHRDDRFLLLDFDASAFILPGDDVVSPAVCGWSVGSVSPEELEEWMGTLLSAAPLLNGPGSSVFR